MLRLSIASMFFCVCASAFAQTFPSRPISLVLPFTAARPSLRKVEASAKAC